ncbi:MAG: hypothetical protein IJB57_09515 [Clostridia bacterium]|nr:hypothetical protein [Clostridia bacterium]
MRYFKYKRNPSSSESIKNELKELGDKEKTLYRKSKILKYIGNVVFFVILIPGIITSLYLISRLPDTDILILDIILTVISVPLMFLGFVASAIIAVFVSMLFWNIEDNSSKSIRQTIRSEVCSELREFYGLCEPLLVTKCFDCTDNKFKDHDVCLYFVDGELRITTNLQYGFYNTNKDLGCYVLIKEEISLSRVSFGQHEAAELTAGKFNMMLGIRAKVFIERNMLDAM